MHIVMFGICTLSMVAGRFLLKLNYAIENFWVVKDENQT